MKRIIKKICIFFAVLAAMAAVSYIDSHYRMEVTVSNVNETLVCFEDKSGELWFFETEEPNEYKVGENVRLTMFDAGTPANIYDDIIEDIHR